MVTEEAGTSLGIFWAWVEQTQVKMAGAVDSVKSWLVEGVGLHQSLNPFSMDTLSTLLIGWVFFGVLGLILCKVLFDKYINSPNVASDEFVEDIQSAEVAIKNQIEYRPEVSRKPTIVPDICPPADIANTPIGAGADPDAVQWANTVFNWLYNGNEAGPVFTKTWLQALNDFTIDSALETGVLVEVLELLPVSTAPKLTNVIVDCSPADNITITCDCCCTLYLRVQTTRTQRDVTTESEYACVVRPLRGRLNVAAIMQTLTGLLKFDGWPEVSLQLEGIRNNTTGLDETSLQDVVQEVLTSALRNVVLEVTFQDNKTFPKFVRARQIADPILPVGYDAMVRQTHPPSKVDKKPFKSKPNIVSYDEVINPTKESVSSMSFPSTRPMTNFSAVALTTSEEQLVMNLKNTVRNDSLTDSIDIPQIIAEYEEYENEESILNGEWEENYIPTNDRFETSTDNYHQTMIEIEAEHETNDEPVSGKFVLMVSSREKPIDESRPSVLGVTDDEAMLIEDEYEDDFPIHDVEPIMREREAHPRPIVMPQSALLETPKYNIQRQSVTPTSEPSMTPEVPEVPLADEENLDDIDDDLSFLKRGEVGFPDRSLVSGGAVPSNHRMMGGNQPNSQPFVNAQHNTSMGTLGIPGLNGKRLLVKIVKGTGIGCEKHVRESYAVVEMDDPAQKFTTSVVKETNSPFWDEQFLFDLSEGTLEILFEIYDKFDNSFHGLGIVGIEELIATPSQRQIIPLQARPYENDQVSGSLTVEFLFLDRADFPELALRSSAVSQSTSSRGVVTTTTTTYIKPPDITDVIVNGADGVATAVLRDIEERKATNGGSSVVNPNTKSTMVIHACRKPELDVEEDEMEQTSLASWRPQSLSSATTTTPSQPWTTTSTVMPPPSGNHPYAPSTNSTRNAINSTEDANNDFVEDSENAERGRSRRKKDSFFGSLKKRFSRSKLRSKSMDPNALDPSLDTDTNVARSISMERSASTVRTTGLLTVPGTGGDGGSTRSSLSDNSGISGSSTRTYINENSSLIVETIENSVVKHYLIPLSLQNRSKWRKKGTKLHVFNEHIFIAKHMPSSTPCQVCHKSLGRRFGKQGYECRDCGFKTHKPCHVKMDTICPNSTVNTMDLTMIKDSREERRARSKSKSNRS